MIMKAIIFILGVMFITNSNAQKFDCPSKMSEYQELFKAKKNTESFDTWTAVSKNCPKQNEAVYTDGIEIIQYKINNAASAEEKEKLVRDVLKLYDQYNKYFPLTTTDFEVNKAMTLVANKIDAKEEIFTLLDRGFTKASNKVDDTNAIYTYFSMYCEKFNNGDKSTTSNSVLEKYTLVNSLLNQLQAAKPDSNESEQAKQNSDYKTDQTAINKLIKDYEAKSLTADEISKAKMNGKLVTIGCWINETITFPAK